MSDNNRLALARDAIARYEAWLAGPPVVVPPDVLADLATCTKWLIEEHEKA